jgi:hypothetical protein
MTTVGSVNYLVDFDGKALPAKARKIGEEAGQEAGQGFNDRFEARFSKLAQELLPEMDKTGRLGGARISDAMENAIELRLKGIAAKIADAFLTPSGLDNFASNFDSVDEAANQLRGDLQLLHDAGSLNDKMWGRFGGTINQWLGGARDTEAAIKAEKAALEDLAPVLDDVDKKQKRVTKSNNDQGASWKNLSINARQALLIIAALASGAEEIAVLGSAAGAGIVIFGAAAVTAGVGLGVLIAGLVGLKQEMADITERNTLLNVLPEDLTDAQLARLDALQAKIAGFDPAVQSIMKVTAAFHDMQDAIEKALLGGLAPAIDNVVTVLLPTLQSGFVTVADGLNAGIDNLLARLTTPAAQAELTGIFTTIGAQMPILLDVIGNVGAAIGGLLTAAGPFVSEFLLFLQKITTEFDNFVHSAEGKNALAEWFSNGEKILSSFSDLLGGAGKLLANLVTPESVARTQAFLDHLTNSLPFLEKLFTVLGDLDIFGLFAQVLDEIGNGLVPILDLVGPIASIINSLLKPAIATLGILFQTLGILLTPLKFVLDIVAQAMAGLATYMAPLLQAFSDILAAIQLALDDGFAQLQPALDDLGQAILDLLPSPEELARILKEDVIPWITQFASDLETKVIPWISKTIEWLADFLEHFSFEKAMKNLDDFLTDLRIFADTFILIIGGPLGAVIALIDAINILNGKNISAPLRNLGSDHTIGGPGNAVAAAGGIAGEPTWGLWGDNGREALVPLDTPLSQVDPSVRALSALAQGKQVPGSPAGGPSIVVEAGAIVVAGVSDNGQAADAMLDRLVALVGV